MKRVTAWIEQALSQVAARNRVTALVGSLLLLAVFAIGLVASDPREPSAILFGIPVVLIALALGTAAGAGAGLVSGLLFLFAAVTQSADTSHFQVGYRVAILTFLGAVTGWLSRRLDETEREAARLLQLAHDGVWTIDDEGRTTYANPRLAELLGTSVDELLGTPPERWVGEERELPARLDRRRHGVSEQYETTLRRADGTFLWVLISATPLDSRRGRARGSLKLVTDIGDRRHADEELRRSEAALAEAQSIAHLGSWEWDVRADVVRWSAELYRIFGVDPDEGDVTYAEYLARIHPDERATIESNVQRAFETGEGFAFRHRAVHPDGSVRVIDSTGNVTREDGDVVRMAGTAHDVTDRVEAEEAARAAREQLALQAELGRRAVELNDEVVQGLAVTGYLLSAGDIAGARDALAATLGRAQDLVGDLIGADVEAGSLRRDRPAEAE